MNETNKAANEWLSHEDESCRQDRLARLMWIADKMPEVDYLLFHGLMSNYLFEEARYCFVYGQFLATIVLGLAFIEQSLAALFYATGRNDLERANITTLLIVAFENNWITETELNNLEHARKIRNPITHFRRPGYNDTVEWRSVNNNDLPSSIIEEDAYHVMETIFHLMGTNLLCLTVSEE